jgi:Arc/MetJ-type ribon-helix-helix transcriptional regulator
VTRRRLKITVSLDQQTLAAIDAHLVIDPEVNRSAVSDDALRLWRERELERESERQFGQPDGVDALERAAWDAIRRASARCRLAREE